MDKRDHTWTKGGNAWYTGNNNLFISEIVVVSKISFV